MHARAAALRYPVLEDLPDPAGRAVLVRATLDLPMGRDVDDPMARRRADALATTLRWLVDRQARVTVCGDAGGGDRAEEVRRFRRVRHLIEDLVPGVAVADSLSGGGASAEEPRVVEALVSTHELFVNDSPQSSYLPLPSLVLPARRLPSAVGRSLQHDLQLLTPLLEDPERPLVAVLGGNRPFLRLHGLEGLVLRADKVLLGGTMAPPMLRAIGRQPPDGAPEDFLAECRAVYGLGARVAHQIVLPFDLVWAGRDGTVQLRGPDEFGSGEVVDIGPMTRRRFAEAVEGAATVLWLGALGKAEDPRFAAGTQAVADALDPARGPTVIGGDALVSVLHRGGRLTDGVEILSATDSSLELLKNGDLPAVVAMRRHH